MLYKNNLLNIPPKKIDVTRKGKSDFLAVAQIIDDDKCGEVYNLDVYDNKTGRPLHIRFFSDGNTYQIYVVEKEKWTQCTLGCALYGYNYIGYSLYYGDTMKASVETMQLTRKFFEIRDSNKGINVARIVNQYITDRQYEKKLQAESRKEERLRAHMKMFPALPKDFNDYLKKDVFSGYIFMGNIHNGHKPGVCTCCKRKVKLDRGTKHRRYTKCPKCGQTVIAFETRYISSIKNKAKVCVTHKVENQLLIRWTDVWQEWRIENGKPKDSYESDDYFHMLYLTEKGKLVIYCYDCKNVYPWGAYWRAKKYTNTDLSYVYNRNLTEVFGQRYYNVDLAKELGKNTQQLRFIQLLDNLKKLPPAEYLVKMGMYRLASELHPSELGKGRDFKSILGINPQYKQMYSKWNISADEHYLIKSANEWVHEEDFLKVRRLHLNSAQIHYASNMLQTMSYKRFANYFTRQRQLYPRNTFDQLMRWYTDYIEMSKQMEIDLSHKSVRFPKDIKIAHDRLATKAKAIENAFYDEQLRRASENLYKGLTEYKADGYAIVFPRTRTEFVVEGQSLNHCVGTQETYYNNHIEGEKMIFFIRHVDDIQTPFVTMQVDMRRCTIIQIYGYGDKIPAPEVRKFANKFVSLLKKKDVEQRRAS